MNSFATYAHSCRICPLEFFIVFKPKNNEKFRWANATAMREYEMNPPLVLGVFWL